MEYGFGMTEAPISRARTLQGVFEGGGGDWGIQKCWKSEILKMKFPIMENVRTSSDIVLVIYRGLQLPGVNGD